MLFLRTRAATLPWRSANCTSSTNEEHPIPQTPYSHIQKRRCGNTVRRGTLLVERRSPISRVWLSDTWECPTHLSRHNSESAGRVARLHDHVPKHMCLIVLLIDAAACPFGLETRHVEGCVERSRVPSRNSASCSLHFYRYWQCDRVYCWLGVKREHSIELLLGSEGPVRCSSPPCAETSLLQP